MKEKGKRCLTAVLCCVLILLLWMGNGRTADASEGTDTIYAVRLCLYDADGVMVGTTSAFALKDPDTGDIFLCSWLNPFKESDYRDIVVCYGTDILTYASLYYAGKYAVLLQMEQIPDNLMIFPVKSLEGVEKGAEIVVIGTAASEDQEEGYVFYSLASEINTFYQEEQDSAAIGGELTKEQPSALYGGVVVENGTSYAIGVLINENQFYSPSLLLEETRDSNPQPFQFELQKDYWMILVGIGGLGGLYYLYKNKKGYVKKGSGTQGAAVYVLKGRGGHFQGMSLPFKGELTIGRDSRVCNLVFPENTSGISRKHCLISAEEEKVTLCDLNSSYGTYLENGERLEPGRSYSLQAGDRFYLAGAENMFSIEKK